MNKAAANRTFGMTIISILALVQGLAGVLRALQWFNVGGDLMGRGLLLLPVIGVVAFLRGAFVALIALLYAVFACGMFLGLGWASRLGVVAATVNLLLVFSVIAQGEPLAQAIPWAIVPVIILSYVISFAKREALSGGN